MLPWVQKAWQAGSLLAKLPQIVAHCWFALIITARLITSPTRFPTAPLPAFRHGKQASSWKWYMLKLLLCWNCCKDVQRWWCRLTPHSEESWLRLLMLLRHWRCCLWANLQKCGQTMSDWCPINKQAKDVWKAQSMTSPYDAASRQYLMTTTQLKLRFWRCLHGSLNHHLQWKLHTCKHKHSPMHIDQWWAWRFPTKQLMIVGLHTAWVPDHAPSHWQPPNRGEVPALDGCKHNT